MTFWVLKTCENCDGHGVAYCGEHDDCFDHDKPCSTCKVSGEVPYHVTGWIEQFAYSDWKKFRTRKDAVNFRDK